MGSFCVILASGDVASKVIIEKRTESVMAFYKGSGDFYLGYITLKVCYPSVLPHVIGGYVWFDVVFSAVRFWIFTSRFGFGSVLD